MDEGTDAKDILENKLLPLRRGEDHPHNHTKRHLQYLFWLIYVVCRLHRCGQPQSERHWWEKGHSCCFGCREEVLPVPPFLQTHSRAYGHTTSSKDTQPGLLLGLCFCWSLHCDIHIPFVVTSFLKIAAQSLCLFSNWPTTSETHFPVCEVSCRVSFSPLKRR